MLPRITGASETREKKRDSKEERGCRLLEDLPGMGIPSTATLGFGEATDPGSPPVPAAPSCYFGLFLGVGRGTARVTAGSRVTFVLRVYFFPEM